MTVLEIILFVFFILVQVFSVLLLTVPEERMSKIALFFLLLFPIALIWWVFNDIKRAKREKRLNKIKSEEATI